MSNSTWLLVLCLGASAASFADIPAGEKKHTETKVIYEAGKTINATRYYSKITLIEEKAEKNASDKRTLSVPRNDTKLPITMSSMFPIRTENMGPGDPHTLEHKNIYIPFFIIGMDRGSIGWLQNNYKALSNMKANGIVVEASSFTDWTELKHEALQNGVMLTLLPGDGLADMYGISTYPVLVRGN